MSSTPVNLRQLLLSKPSPQPRSSKIVALIIFIVVSLIGGLLATVVLLPYTLTATGATVAALDWWARLPHTLSEVEAPQRSVLLDKNGKVFAQLFSENRIDVPLSSMAPAMQHALIDTEDARFYQHEGMDPKGVARALVNNMLGGSLQGASTITQQLVENLRVSLAHGNPALIAQAHGDSPRGKLEEVRFAQGLEQQYSKRSILEAYLNLVYFGNGAYGVEAAAQRYFQRDASALTIPQAATLVAMLKSPTAYDPIAHPDASRLRRDVVMKRMVAEHDLGQRKYEKFIKHATPITGEAPQNGCGQSRYPFYCQLTVESFLSSPEFGRTRQARERRLHRGGLTLTTALDPATMKSSQIAMDQSLGRNNRVASASASIEPGTGHVLAISENRHWGTSRRGQYNRTQLVYANTPAFQIGSTFKAITATAALEAGYPPDTRLNAPSPASFPDLDEPEGGFKNDTRHGYGIIDMATALRYSVNTYFVGLEDEVGVKAVASMARRLGMTSVPDNLTGREGSLTLGTYVSDPLQLATVYATLAGRGVECEPVIITAASVTETGENLTAPNGNCHQEINPSIADTMANLLQAPFTDGGTAAHLRLENGRRAAGKTGTTDDAAATWFAGFTPQLATAVWVGDPRGGESHPLYNVSAFGTVYGDVFGGTIAGPIWKTIMDDYHRSLPQEWFPSPGGASVSLTPRVVPNVSGVSLNSAVTTLLENGFHVRIAKTTQSVDNVSATNYIARQSPVSGGQAVYGDTITLTLTPGSDTAIRVPYSLAQFTATQHNDAKAPGEQ